MVECFTFHYDVERSGTGTGAPASAVWHRYNAVNLGSTVRGALLYVQNWNFLWGPHAGETHNLVIVATSDNRVLAYAEDQLRLGSTTTLWSTNVGTPVTKAGGNPAAGHPESNIPYPLGICSTPVLDPMNARMFVVSYQDIGGGNNAYFIFVLDLNSGNIIQSAKLQDPGGTGRPTFDANLQDQRGGLNLVNGRVFASFAAFFAYDYGNYHGWVVSVNANNLNDQWFFSTTNTLLGGGCWGPGGVVAASDGTLYVATGNATNDSAAYWTGIPTGHSPGDQGDWFMALLRLQVQYTGFQGQLTAKDWFQPTNIESLNDADLDFGSSSPVILPAINGIETAVLPAKNDIYLLDRNNLHHLGNELWSAHVFDGESHSAPAYYLTPAGDHYVYISGHSLPGLICYKVVPGSAPPMQEVWRANIDFRNAPGSPTVGVYGTFALVWVADGGETEDPPNAPGPQNGLRAYNAMDGTLVFSSTSSSADDLGATAHYPPVTCAGSSTFVGTGNGFVCYGAVWHKWWKDLKPEIKELKEKDIKELKDHSKIELKENLKSEGDVKQLWEGPKLKDAEGYPQGGGDPWTTLGKIAERVDQIEERLASGRAFIRPEERPPVGGPVRRVEEETSRARQERSPGAAERAPLKLNSSKSAPPQKKGKGKKGGR